MLRRSAILFWAMAAMPLWAEDMPRVEGLRVWESPDRTRAVLDLSGPAEYKIFTLENPHRVVLDLRAHDSADGINSPPAQALLQSVRTGRRGDDLRVVFDVAEKTRPKSFLLEPADRYGHRLVVDLYASSEREAAPAKTLALVAEREVVVAIDAGHGGEDPGAIGPSGIQEKNVTLAIARELDAILDAKPGIRGELVRTGDYYLSLRERPRKARNLRADLFLSIHADAFYEPKVRGSSVFVLSQRRATSEAARWLANRENRADLVGGVKLRDKDQTLAAVLLDLSQGASREASDRVAARVLHSLEQVNRVHKDTVQAANFAVLVSPDIPSILVETAFISNPNEERMLNSKAKQKELAAAIAYGVADYFERYPPPGSWLATHTPKIEEHVVERGETLSEIAVQHRVSIGALRAANGISGDMLKVGQKLAIPTS